MPCGTRLTGSPSNGVNHSSWSSQLPTSPNGMALCYRLPFNGGFIMACNFDPLNLEAHKFEESPSKGLCVAELVFFTT